MAGTIIQLQLSVHILLITLTFITANIFLSICLFFEMWSWRETSYQEPPPVSKPAASRCMVKISSKVYDGVTLQL